jgi:hypothetical protein
MALWVTEQAAQYVVGERRRHDLLVLWVREIEPFMAGISGARTTVASFLGFLPSSQAGLPPPA